MRTSLVTSGCALALIAALPRTGLAEPHDIHYTAEHVLENSMDVHHQALPWPGSELSIGRWQTSVDLSIAQTHDEFVDLDGPMLAFAAAAGVSERWGYEVLGFYGDMRIGGGAGDAPLGASFLLNVPLDLPQPATFTAPRGTLQHYGVGGAFVHKLGERPTASSRLIAGVLLEHMQGKDFGIDYRLLAGADAGTTGTIDHSNSATYLTPFVGWEQTRSLGSRWSWSPRAMFFLPLPPAELHSRIVGPGFDIATPSPGANGKFGDGFVTLGIALTHEPSGFEIDLGGLLLFPISESLSHPGVDRSSVLHVTWRNPGQRGQ